MKANPPYKLIKAQIGLSIYDNDHKKIATTQNIIKKDILGIENTEEELMDYLAYETVVYVELESDLRGNIIIRNNKVKVK